jgi:hypothetical protein
MLQWKASDTEKVKQVCAVCGKPSPLGHYLVFNELKGCPLICGLCMYEKLTGTKGEWGPKTPPASSSVN